MAEKLVCVIELDLFLPNCRSLKEKRKVVQSLESQLKNKFNISITEVNKSDLWQRVGFLIASVGEKGYLDELFKDLQKFITQSGHVEILDSNVTYY